MAFSCCFIFICYDEMVAYRCAQTPVHSVAASFVFVFYFGLVFVTHFDHSYLTNTLALKRYQYDLPLVLS